MIHIEDTINRKADHIIVWKDENGWHAEDWGNKNLLPIHGDIRRGSDPRPAREGRRSRPRVFLGRG